MDDVDGGPAVTTVQFGFDGTCYEIGLTEAHASQFAWVMELYVERARRMSRQQRPAQAPPRRDRPDQSEVRAWARGQGLKVSDRGRIPADVLARFEVARWAASSVKGRVWAGNGLYAKPGDGSAGALGPVHGYRSWQVDRGDLDGRERGARES